MKRVLRVAGGVVVFVVLLLAVVRATGFEPKICESAQVSWTCRTPGLWLKGDLVTTPVTDWSFTDRIQSIKLQTVERFLPVMPHSITTYCVSYNGELYLTSVYGPGMAEYPHGRHWNENVYRDPHVRLKIEDKIYDRKLEHVTDEAVRAEVIKNKAKKYPKQVIRPGSYINIYHVVPN